MVRKSKIGRLVGVALVALLSAGCATHSQRTEQSLHHFVQGDVDQALVFFERHNAGRNRYLHLLEAGRMRQLSGDFAGSRRAFDQVIEHVIVREEGAVIRLRDVGGVTLAGTLTDDRMRPFVLAYFETVMLFVAQAMNHWMLGEPEAAWVQLRRAAAVQDLWRQEAAERQQELPDDEARQEYLEKSMERFREQSTDLIATAARVANSQENPFAWYLAGVMFEHQDDMNGSYQAFRRASEMMPDNHTFRRDYLRLGVRVHRPEYLPKLERYGIQVADLETPASEVLVVFDEALISRRRVERIPIFTGTWQMFNLPFYSDPPHQPASLQVRIDGGAEERLQPAVYVQSLAYRDLQEQMNGVMLRNITRAVARQVAYSASQQSEAALVNLLGLLFNITTLIADSADTRSWYTLPMTVQLARLPVEPGERTLRITHVGTGREHQVDLTAAQGQLQLVWVADLGSRSQVAWAGLDRSLPGHAVESASILGHISRGNDGALVSSSRERTLINESMTDRDVKEESE